MKPTQILANVATRRRLLRLHPVVQRVAIPFAGSALCWRVPQVPMKEAHRQDLILVGNPFFFGVAPELGDVFQVLWRCHPYFLRPDGAQPNRPSGAARVGLFLRLQSFLERRALLAHVRRSDLAAAVAVLGERITESERAAERLIPTESQAPFLVGDLN